MKEGLVTLPRVSVVIATFNRPLLLAQTLETILAQDYPSELFEILVVDNNSTPETRATVESFAHRYPSPCWIWEGRQGVSVARNTGIAKAKGDVMVFADDDVLAERDWLRNLMEPFCSEHGDRIGAVGGAVNPIFPEGRPSWWRYTHPLRLADGCTALAPGQERNLMGANLAVPKTVLEQVGGFRSDLGRKGIALLDGEEQELLRRIRAAGYEIWSASRAVVRHQMPRSRLTLRHACRNAYDSARAHVIDKCSNPSVSMPERFRYLLARSAGNVLLIPIWVLGAIACGMFGQTGNAKRFLVRLARSFGYLRQIFQMIGGRDKYG